MMISGPPESHLRQGAAPELPNTEADGIRGPSIRDKVAWCSQPAGWGTEQTKEE